MCFHLYPTGFCCQGNAMNWFITLEDHVYSAPLCIISHAQPLRCPCSFTLNSVTVNCQYAACCSGLACWQMARRRGPRRVLSEAVRAVLPQQSWEIEGWRRRDRQQREGEKEMFTKYICDYFECSFKSTSINRVSVWDRHSINVCENNKMLTLDVHNSNLSCKKLWFICC